MHVHIITSCVGTHTHIYTFLVQINGFFNPHPIICLLIFLEREGGREEHQCERETSIGCLRTCLGQGSNPQPTYVPCPRIEPATFSVYRTMLLPPEPLGRAKLMVLFPSLNQQRNPKHTVVHGYSLNITRKDLNYVDWGREKDFFSHQPFLILWFLNSGN